MRVDYYVPTGKFRVHRYAQQKIGSQWKKFKDEIFDETDEILNETGVYNILNGYNPLSSKERRIWDVYRYKGKVFSYSPYYAVRHVWEIEYIGRY